MYTALHYCILSLLSFFYTLRDEMPLVREKIVLQHSRSGHKAVVQPKAENPYLFLQTGLGRS